MRARAVAALSALAFLMVACTSGAPAAPASPSPAPTLVPASPESPSPPADGPESAQSALERLCTVKAPKPGGGSSVPPEGPTPPAIEQVMRQLEQIRGFDFAHPVIADPSTQAEIGRGFQRSLERAVPTEQYARRSIVWQTIGVIPAGTQIRDELAEYGGTQVIGYYDTVSGELVFLGGENPSPLESITLAHELTHAIDDQRFGLERLDALGAECEDDALEGAIALVEGNATYFMYEWARTFLSADQQLDLVREAAAQQPPPSDVAPFIQALQIWPYNAGLAFLTKLEQRGGLEAVDRAFEVLPASSEQIMHPERYPNDVPTPVDVTDLSPALGPGWDDLDVMDVGEVWLDTALSLRLDGAESTQASSGWDGGIYRAWTDGRAVAVVLATTWDTEHDAQEFMGSMGRWLDEGAATHGLVLDRQGSDVRVLFGSDAATLRLLETASI